MAIFKKATLFILSACLLFSAKNVFAGVSITKATGGEALSGADVLGPWTTVSAIVIKEGMPRDIIVQDFILSLPEGFEFNTSTLPNVTVSGGTELLAHFGSLNQNSLVINVAQASATVPHILTIGSISSLQIRPTKNEAIEGRIYMFSSSLQGAANGLSGTSFGDLAIVPVEEAAEPVEEEGQEEDGQQEEEAEEELSDAEVTKQEFLDKIEEIKNQIEALKQKIVDILKEKIKEISALIVNLRQGL